MDENGQWNGVIKELIEKVRTLSRKQIPTVIRFLTVITSTTKKIRYSMIIIIIILLLFIIIIIIHFLREPILRWALSR